MRFQATYQGPDAQRFALEPPPYGPCRPQVAYQAQKILDYVSEPGEPGPQFVQLLACDAYGTEVVRKRIAG